MSWIPLHVHSQYSILDSTASVDAIAKKAAAYGMPAAALTDHGNLFGCVDFFKACQKNKVKPIIGMAAYMAPGSRLEKTRVPGRPAAFDLVLLAKNAAGYRNLCKLSSLGHLEGFYYYPRIDKELLERYHEGLICLSGDALSYISFLANSGFEEELRREALWYKNLFGEDYYFEVSRHPMTEERLRSEGYYQESWLLQKYHEWVEREEKVCSALVTLGRELGIRLVATNDSHYIDRDDWKAHEILINVLSGEPVEILEQNGMFKTPNPKRDTYSTHELYFKSQEEMAALFHDIPDALAASVDIAAKCQLELDFKTKHYPVFTPPSLQNQSPTKEERDSAIALFLRELCEKGIPVRYTPERLAKVQEVYPGQDPLTVVKERLDYEINIIVPKGLADYLLIVWDFIYWAKSTGIPMGPGRGSGAGSIICYLIGITDIEPLRFHLFFERFINPERLSYPDIDVDICMDKRNEVINYTVNKYGKNNVAQIITFGTMKAKMAIKDVGRVLNVPLAKVNQIAKLVPEELNITLERALETDPELHNMYENDEETHRLFDLAKKLEGSIRNTGIHAAGVIISGEPLTEHIPLCRSKDSDLAATQYSMKPVETVGMLKVDFLGLKTLTSIQICVDMIKANHGIAIDWVNLPLDDTAAFSLLNQGKTLGCFQMESGGMQDLARQLHLDKFEEIIAVVSLYRPGPMDMIPSFIARKHGREPIEYDHEWMQEILSETYGIMVYQEQVMQIAQKLANYSLGEGDVLRRAMGKKDMAEMAKQREKFLAGAAANGIGIETATVIFDKMEKFAAYGFNKSHAAAYGYLTYVTAYLKSNYPKEWMAALMTCDSDDTAKVAKFIGESQSMGIKILPPDINNAGTTFKAGPDGICFAISAIKGVGMGAVESIIEQREARGAFSSLYDFICRIDSKKVGKKTIETMSEAGCFDFTGWSRDELRESVEGMFESAQKERKEREAGILSLFSLLPEEETKPFSKPPKVRTKRTKPEMLAREKELLGFFLTGHPMDHYKNILQRLSCVSFQKIPQMENRAVFRSAFIIETVGTRIAQKSQKKFAILTISDGIDRFELPIWPELYEEKHHLLVENKLIYAVLTIEKQHEEIKLGCTWLDDLSLANEAMLNACDGAFDKEKMRQGKLAFQRKGAADSGSKNTKPKQEEKKVAMKEKPPSLPKLFQIDANVEAMRLSHILKIRDILHNHPGSVPTKISFKEDSYEVAILHLDQSLVDASESLKNSLCDLPGIAIA